MRFFKRPSTADPTASIEAFWQWWVTDRDRIAAAVADGSVESWVPVISERVNAINSHLAWELSKGSAAQHALVVTPEGDQALRHHAMMWLAQAPARDAVWEYFAARQPGPLGSLVLDGLNVDLAEFRAIVSWDGSRARVDVRLWHPSLEGPADDVRMRAAFLFLDNLLGEDDVERWIGSIDLLDAPTGGRTPDELRAEVARRAAETSEDQWTLGEIGDGEAIAVLNLTIKPIDHPECRFHLKVTIARGIEQLAHKPDETAEVDAAEDRLVEALGAVGVVHLGHVTGRRDRQVHFMCADGDRAKQIATDWATAERRFSPRVDVRADPGWEVRRELGM
jgi:hypothetical protein